MEQEDSYTQEVASFEALRAVIQKFGTKRAFIRSTVPVTPAIQRHLGPSAPRIGANRDRAVCALVNKACNTHAAIRLLADAGHGDDAMALGRVLLENVMILKWLLIDPIYRLDLYCISGELHRRRWSQLAIEHYQAYPDHVAKAEEALKDSKAVAGYFGNTKQRWAKVPQPEGKSQPVNFEEMMREVAAHDGTQSTFLYDVIYSLHSAYVHSTASSIRSFRQLDQVTYFNADLGPNRFIRATALGGANLFLVQALQAAADYLGFSDLKRELDLIVQDIWESLEKEPEEGEF